MSTAEFRPRLIEQEMRNGRWLPWGSLCLFAILSLADLSLTWFLLNYSGGKIYESNPIASAWLASYGWAGLIIYKVMGLLLVGGVATFISLRQPETGKRVLTFAICALAAVTVYSYYLLVNTF
jgi:hypothetical protein